MTRHPGETAVRVRNRRRSLAPRLLLPAGLAASSAAALSALLAGCFGGVGPEPDLALEGEAFGTRWTVRTRGAPGDPADLRSAVETELDAVDRSMSSWRADSELSRLNRSKAPGPVPLSPPLARVLEAALRIGEESGGAFEITVGPLLRRFGFGPDGDRGAPPPTPEAAAAERARVGSGLVSLERLPDGQTLLHRTAPGIELDLSGIAKGYAVDRVSRALDRLGFSEHLVEVGGEIRIRGRWTVGVETPSILFARRVHRSFRVADLGLATSGGYRDFRAASPANGAGGGSAEGGALRYWTHILDPRTGQPVERWTESVTVLAGSCLEADAWATALFVLGPAAGLELAGRRGLAALFLRADRDGAIGETATPAFAAAIRSGRH